MTVMRPATKTVEAGRRVTVPPVLRSPLTISCLVVTGAVIAANLAYLVGWFDANPIAQYSNLTSSVTPGLLPGQNNIDPNLGYTAQALGHLAALDWLHGHVPWWNPFEGFGTPLAGEMQSAAFFPLVLLDALSNGQVYFRIVLESVAGLSMLFLLRRLVASSWAATAGAVVFALNGTFAWMFHAPGNPVAFAPMLILGIEQARSRRSRGFTGWPMIAVAVALSLYAGFPEVAFIDGLLAVLWAAVRASHLRGRDLRAFVGRVTAGVAVGTALAAPILVAFASFVQNAYLVHHAGHGFENVWLSANVALPAAAMPYIHGPIFAWLPYDHSGSLLHFWSGTGGYVGMSVLVLGLVGVVGRPERRLRLALTGWLILALGRSFGMPGVRQLVNAVPGVKYTAFHRYSEPTWTLAFCVLAVLAIDDLMRRRRRVPVVAAGLAASVITAYLAYRSYELGRLFPAAPHGRTWEYASVAFAGVVIVACVVPATLVRSARGRTAVLGTVMALEALAFFVVPEFSAPRSAAVDTAPVRFLQSHLGQQRFFTLGPIAPNYGSFWGIASAGINDVPIVRRFYAYVGAHLNADPGVFTGTVSPSPSGPSPRQELLARIGEYEAVGVKYVVMPPGSAPLVADGHRLPVVFSDHSAEIVQLPSPAPLYSAEGGGCRVLASRLSSATVTCFGAGRLLRREQYIPGWTATANGNPLNLSADQSVFQSVPLQAGRSVVSFSYTPPHAGAAGAAALLAAAIVALTVAVRSRRGRNRWLPGDGGMGVTAAPTGAPAGGTWSQPACG